MKRVTVVGAGVVGLTAAAELAAAGHDVSVIAERTGDDTTSAVAAALWFPYRAGPPAAVARWARRTRARLEAIAAAHPEAGVDRVTAYELTGEPPGAPPPWWIDAAPDAERVATDLPGRPLAWRFVAPRVEPARFLPWLAARLPRPIARGRVERLADVPGDVVVNCAGLGARALCGDAALVGLAGQVVVAAPGALDLAVAVSDDRTDDLFYAIPRRGEVVLGGCARAVDGDEPPPEDPALTARILADAARLGLAPGPVLRVRRALRPYRPEVRLERDPADPRVIHAYGHGGAGFTLALGCAEDVAALVAAG